MMTNANASTVLDLWTGVNRQVCCPYKDDMTSRIFLAGVWDAHYEKSGGVCTGGAKCS